MSRPDLKAIGKKGWSVPVDKLPRFVCQACKFKGRADELLAEDDNETLRCPRCKTADWIWK